MFTRKLAFWTCLIAMLAADLVTKAWASANVEPLGDRIQPVIPGFLAWKWALNQGAAFSMFDGHVAFLAIVAAVVLGAVFVYMYKAEPRRWVFALALGLVASGAIGNLTDRIILGHVRDFIFFDFDLPLWGQHEVFGFAFELPRRWPVFNVADIAIMLGVGILLVQSFRPQPKAKGKDKTADTSRETGTPGEQTNMESPAGTQQPEPQEAAAGAEQR